MSADSSVDVASVSTVKSFDQKIAECKRAGHWVEHTGCWQCAGEGVTDHDCGEDCCCCLNPEPNVTCDICDGDGGYEICFTCNPGAYDDHQ